MSDLPAPIVLTTERQRALQRAFRRNAARLPGGYRMARDAGATASSGGMQATIGKITASLLEAQEAEKHGLWRFEALLSRSWTLHGADETAGGVCAICFDRPLGDPALPCGHAFGCAECSAPTVGTECPICRGPVDSIGPAPDGVRTFRCGADVPRNVWIVFRAASAGSKRSRAWKAGLRDDVVLLRDSAEMAAALDLLLKRDDEDAPSFTALTDYAAASSALFWSAVVHVSQTTTSEPLDARVFAFLNGLRSAKKAKTAEK